MTFRATLSIILMQGLILTTVIYLSSGFTSAATVAGVTLVGVIAVFGLRDQLDRQGS